MTETIDLNRELRRYQNTLVVAGTAVIAFGAWSIIKMLMILGANLDRIGELLSIEEEDFAELKSMDNMELVFATIIMIMFLAGIFLLYFYIGRNAQKEGMGIRHRAYFALALILVIPQAFIAVYSVADFVAIRDFDLELIITLLVDLSALYALVELDVAAIRVRLVTKKLKGEEG